jgi:hypothetical protein
VRVCSKHSSFGQSMDKL